MYRETYVEINLKRLKENVLNIVSKYNDYNYYIGVVKANAYGYGEKIVNSLIEGGINYLAVSNLEEALLVRKQTSIDILCLEPISIKYINVCIENNITITLSNYDYFKELLKLNIDNLKIHLKIDSGMNRLGFKNKEEIKEVYNKLKNNIEGIYTHMASTGINDKLFDNQVDTFLNLTSKIDLSKIKIIHLGRSSTIINHPKMDFVNGTRIGILMYGIKPSPIIYSGLKGKLRKLKREMTVKKLNISSTMQNCDIDVKPAFNLISEIIEIKNVKKGEHIGYGVSCIADCDMKIGIIPVGYGDGFDLRNKGRKIKINNDLYTIIGSINSGMITVEIDEKIKLHDKVVVIGDNIKEIASYTHTTPYVVTSNINANVPRVYIEK